jgi:hypothetical protein
MAGLGRQTGATLKVGVPDYRLGDFRTPKCTKKPHLSHEGGAESSLQKPDRDIETSIHRLWAIPRATPHVVAGDLMQTCVKVDKALSRHSFSVLEYII